MIKRASGPLLLLALALSQPSSFAQIRAQAQIEVQAPAGFPDARLQPAPQPAAEPVAEKPLPEPKGEDLQKLASGLNSDSFEIRDRSQAALAKYARLYPSKVKESLAEDFLSSVDPEVRYRLAEVIYDAVVDDMGHSGFLGIIMEPSTVTIDNQLTSSIQIREVLKSSAASRAGLQVRDHIIQVDGHHLSKIPADLGAALEAQAQAPQLRGRPTDLNTKRFQTYIGGRKKGSKVTLKVHRAVGREFRTLEVDVRLGRRTRDLMLPAERAEEERFFDNWIKSNQTEAKKPE